MGRLMMRCRRWNSNNYFNPVGEFEKSRTVKIIVEIDTRNRIERVFRKEFGLIESKFRVFDISVSLLLASQEEFIYNPGVYIFYKGADVIKVGRHLQNSRKRAWQHIHENTRNEQIQMKDLAADPDAKVLLLNVIDPKDSHWVAAVEIYLESSLNPMIHSKRLG
jgi:hypothetical protein